jgi:hypothetical protein
METIKLMKGTNNEWKKEIKAEKVE